MRKLPAWSYSFIKAFEQCPKKFYHTKVVKDYKDEMGEAANYGNECHKAAENYVKYDTPLPAKFAFIKRPVDTLVSKQGTKICEHKMGLTEKLEPCGFFDKDVWYRGVADLIILDEENNLAWVIDYKTSKNANYADKGQLELMALCVFKHFPKVTTVRAGLVFLVCNKLVKETYTKEDEPTLWRKWLSDHKRMEITFGKDVWNAHPSGLCRKHCVVLECPHNGRN